MDEYWVGFTAILMVALVLLTLIIAGFINGEADQVHKAQVRVAYINACRTTPDPTLCLTRVP